MKNLTILIICTIGCFGSTFATFDMNVQEYQLVADHITQTECRQLIHALNGTEFYLSHNVTVENVTEEVACIDLLLAWDTGPGAGKPFVDIAIRLREIGREDVAEKLSRTVYHEKAEAVRKTFLDDPFKSMIHTNSPLLVESPHFGATGKPTGRNQWTWWHITCMALLAVMLSGLASVLIILACPWCCCECVCCEFVARRVMGVPNHIKVDDDERGAYSIV